MIFIIIALAATVIVVLVKNEQWFTPRTGADPAALSGLLFRWGGLFLTLGIIATVATQGMVIIPPGRRGIVFNTVSGLRQTPLGEGVNFIIPILEQVVVVDVRVQKDAFDATAASKDLQMVHTKVALNYHPTPETTPKILQSVGLEYPERLIHPAVQEAVKATTARFTAEELIARREDVKAEIKLLVEKQVTPYGILIDEVYITDFDFSKQFAEAIEFKQIAEQQALKAKRDLDRIKIEAEQKIAGARAEAEGLKMQREALTPNLIQLRAIEKWDGHLPDVMSSGGPTPLLNLKALTPRE